MGSTIFKNLTKVNLVASYSVSTIKNGDFEDDIIYYCNSFSSRKELSWALLARRGVARALFKKIS